MSNLDIEGGTLAANHEPKDLGRDGLDSDSEAEPEPNSDQDDASEGEGPVEAAEDETPHEETPSV